MKNSEIVDNYQNATQRHELNKYCWENEANRLVPHKVATNLQFVKHTISAKSNKVKHNETRSAYICENSMIYNETPPFLLGVWNFVNMQLVS